MNRGTILTRGRVLGRGASAYLRRSRLSHFFLLWLAPFLLLMSFLFSEFLKNYNYLEVFPSWLLLPTALHALTALVIAFIAYFVKRPASLAGKLTGALLLGLLLGNYDDRLLQVAPLFRAVVPILPKADADLPIISLLFFIILALISLAIGSLVDRLQRKHATLTTTNLVVGILILPAIVFAGQAVRVAQILPEISRQHSVPPMQLGGNTDKTRALDKPDIYYIVNDRYANEETLREQLSYDNSAFTGFLQQNGFLVRPGAISSYPFTSLSLASTLNADYIRSASQPYENQAVQSRTLYHKLTHEASVIRAVKDAGYTYHNIGSTYGATDRAPLADVQHMYRLKLSVFGKQKLLRGLEGSTFTQSIFYRLAQVKLPGWPISIVTTNERQDVIKQLVTLQDLATSPQQGGRFIFAHILNPHGPYLFNADGSFNPHSVEDNEGKPITQKYTDQVTFINTQLRQIVTSIRERSGNNAVIILNSDEGPYPSSMSNTFKDPAPEATYEQDIFRADMTKWSDAELRMKYGILQAVHIPRATEADLLQLSSVNVFLIVLNRYLGYDLPYLPQCMYALPKGNITQFNQASITHRFGAGPDEIAHCENLLKKR